MAVKKLLVGALIASAMSAATAQVSLVNNRATFNSAGTIAYNSNFDDYAAGNTYPGFSMLPTPFERGDVIYDGGQNIVLGPGGGYSIGAKRGVIASLYYTPLSATISIPIHRIYIVVPMIRIHT